MTSAEEKLARLNKRNAERVKKYRQTHKLRYLSVTLKEDRYDLLDKKLKQLGMTKKQFIENAIDNLE